MRHWMWRTDKAMKRCKRMALPREVCVSLQNNALGRPTPQSPAIENIGLFRELPNPDDPPERKTAAPVGPGSGGKSSHENPDKVFREGFYIGLTRKAIARLHPKIAATSHYVIEPARNRWRLIVRRSGHEHVEFFESKGEANRARQLLTDMGLPGFTMGDRP